MKESDSRPASLRCITAYGLPVGGVAFLLIPSATFIADVYPKFYGLKFTAIATAYLVAGIASALVNPIVGLLCDKHADAGGSRRTWVIAGFALFVASSYQLLAPSRAVTPGYFTVWLTAVMLSWGAFDLPHLALGAELARDYHARTRLFGLRCLLVSCGTACFYILPLLPLFATANITPQTLKWAATIGLVYTIPAVYCLIRYVPDGALRRAARKETLADSVTVICLNRPFLLLVAICGVLGVGEGMWMSLSPVIFDYYYGLGTRLSMMYLASSLLTSASLPLLIRASARIGKKCVFAAVQIAFMTLIAVPLFVRPGPNAYVPLLLVLVGVNMVLIFNNVITNSILADTVDYGQWKYGKGRSASYFAAFNFLLAIFGCVGAPWGLRLIEHFGFTPQGIVDMGRAKTAVELAFCAIPAAMSGIAVALILRIPICRQRAESIRRRLEYRSRVSASHPGSIASTYNGHESQLG